ncbi:Rcs stress response system protein RcsF [Ferrimonas sp.]|uniref:Rcs stress response system protein RcsF n=1 Tax=Ferrimonas sp. TaxID=2080861 RepID=UPI003A8DC3CD
MRHSIIATLLLLGGCSANFEFNSNLDSEATRDYFKAGQVALHLGETPPPGKDLGWLEATSCQQRQADPAASPADARTQLRRKTAELGGNALWVSRCVSLPADDHCLSAITCYGQALQQHED